MNLRSFSLHRNYSYPLTLSNLGKPSWSWILWDHIQVQKEKLNFVVACLRSPLNAKLGIFTSKSRKNGKRNVQKSVMHVQSYCFAYKTGWCFWRSCCRPRHWILKSRIIISSHRNLWFAPCKGIRIPDKFFLRNPESWVLESGIQIKECGIPLMIGVRNPLHWQRIQNPVSGTPNPRHEIQNTGLA